MKIADLRTDLNIAENDDSKLIDALKVRQTPPPVMSAPVTTTSSGGYDDQYNIAGHKVNDTNIRKNRRVKVKAAENQSSDHQTIGKKQEFKTITEYVTRVALAFQKKIVEQAVAFCFGNPVDIKYSPEGANQEKANFALKRILHDNKSYSLDRRVARNLFRSTEVAEYWYILDAPEGFNNYGFPTKKKVRVTLFSPALGDQLFPYFDENGSMIAFSRQFTRTDAANVQTSYFETYTDQEKTVWVNNKGSVGVWQLEPKLGGTYTIGKIPISYACQEEVEWANAQSPIERLETLKSNTGDINNRHASPKTIVSGKLSGMSEGSDQAQTFQVENGGDIKYLEMSQAPDFIANEEKSLRRDIHEQTQTIDFSSEEFQGVSQISTLTMMLKFMDPHLKVKNKEEIFIEYFQRRYSILQSIIGELNTEIKADVLSMQFDPVITPYMIKDLPSLAQFLSLATGGEPVMSQKTAIGVLGEVDDVDKEYDLIQKEAAAKTLVSAFPETGA